MQLISLVDLIWWSKWRKFVLWVMGSWQWLLTICLKFEFVKFLKKIKGTLLSLICEFLGPFCCLKFFKFSKFRNESFVYIFEKDKTFVFFPGIPVSQYELSLPRPDIMYLRVSSNWATANIPLNVSNRRCKIRIEINRNGIFRFHCRCH